MPRARLFPALGLVTLLAAATPVMAQRTAPPLGPTLKPDLAVVALRVESPLGSTACVGTANKVIATVTNKTMVGVLGSFKLALGPIDGEGAYLAAVSYAADVNGIAAGASREVTITGVQGSTTSRPFLFGLADQANVVQETNETNNLGQQSLKLGGLSRTALCPISAPR